MRLVIKQLAILTAICILLVFIGSYTGRILPLGDSLAVIRLPLALLGLTFVLVLRRSWLFGIVFATSALILGDTWIDRSRDTGPDGAYVLYQKNLWLNNSNIERVAADIRAQDADFVTLQEISRFNQHILDMMRDDYPYQRLCKQRGKMGIAVLSRHPIGPARGMCSEGRSFAGLHVITPDGPVWVIAQHLYWPYPKSQHAQLQNTLPQYEGLTDPVILGGDFNMLPNTRVENVVAQATKSTPLRPNFTTLWAGPLPVSIDQIFAKCGIVERRPLLGSDHYGLVARVGFNASSCR